MKTRLLLLTYAAVLSLQSQSADSMIRHILLQAYSHSDEGRIIEMNHVNRMGEILQSMEIIKPNVSLNSSIPGYSRSINSITQPDGSLKFLTQTVAISSLSLNASKNIALTGGSFTLGSGLTRMDVFEPLRSTGWNSNLFLIEYSQPLSVFNEYKYIRENTGDQLKYEHALYLREKNEFFIKTFDILTELILGNEKLKLLLLSKNGIDTLIHKLKGQYEQGKISELDYQIILNEKEKAELDMAETQMSFEAAMSKLRQLRISDTNTQDLLDLTFFRLAPFDIDTFKTRQWMIETSPQRLLYLMNIEHAKQNLEKTNRNLGLKGNLILNYGFNQKSNLFNNLLNAPLNRQSANVTLSLPIGKSKTSRLQKTLAERSLQVSQLEKELCLKTLTDEYRNHIRRHQILSQKLDLNIKSQKLYEKKANLLLLEVVHGKTSYDKYIDALTMNRVNQMNRISTELTLYKMNCFVLTL